jgi:hypothetical protein
MTFALSTNSDIKDDSYQKKKPPEGGSSIQTPDDLDQAAINAGLDFRRYAMKPTPAKPRTIIAHVDGSGTAPEIVTEPPLYI